VPIGAVAVMVDQAVGRLAASTPAPSTPLGGLHVLGACTILVGLIVVAWVISRLPGRGA